MASPQTPQGVRAFVSSRIVVEELVRFRLAEHRWPASADDLMASEHIQAFRVLADSGTAQPSTAGNDVPLPLWVPDKLACLPRNDTRALVIWQPAYEEGTVLCDVAYHTPRSTPDSIRIEYDIWMLIDGEPVTPARVTLEIASPTTRPSATAPAS